ncbi:MAG: OmpP1/FadL family transporter [Oceanococcus sp.]
MPTVLWATNGYFAHGFSLAQKSMGGAGTAMKGDNLAVAINPAGMAWAGDAFDLGLSLFIPIRDYSAGPRGDDASNGIFTIDEIERHRSHNEYWPLPAVSYNRQWGESATLGFSMYGNGGLNTEYIGNSATFGQGLTGFEANCGGGFGGGQANGADNASFCGGGNDRFGVDMAVLFLAPSVSYRLGESSAVGLAPLLVMSRFAAQGLGAFAKFSNSPDHVTNNGHELAYGAGYRLGFLTSILPGVSVGGSYQSRVDMSEFDDYRGLFAEQGDFDIPSTWNAGIAARITEQHTVALDYQQINYNEVASVGLPLDANEFVNNCAIPRLIASFGLAQAEQSGACLGAATGPGFGWQNMQIWKFGYQYSTERYKFRVGYSKTDQPIPSSQVLFNVLAPGVIEQHYTAGFSMQWSEGLFLDVAMMYAPQSPVVGPNPLSNTDANLLGILGEGAGIGAVTGLLGQGTSEAFGADANDQMLRLNMRQYEFTVGLSWRY